MIKPIAYFENENGRRLTVYDFAEDGEHLHVVVIGRNGCRATITLNYQELQGLRSTIEGWSA